MKIVFREQGIEMHILAPVGESPLEGGGGGVALPITSPWPPSKGDFILAPFKGGIKGVLPLQRGNMSVQIKG